MFGWICKLTGHRRVSKRVWNDGVDWRSTCRRCGVPLVRHANRQWAADPGGPKRQEWTGRG